MIYHGAGWADTISDREAIQKQFVPIEDERINKKSGAISDQGYLLVPDSWYIHAQLIGIHGDVVKPAMGDVPTPEHPNGKRQAFLDGKL